MSQQNKIQMEWDLAAYQRKFHQTLSYLKVGDEEPAWRWVASITDSCFVYEDARKKPIGQIVMQCTKGQVVHNTNDYPIVQFLYQQILPGAYYSAKGGGIYYLTKRHIKSYKIGLSDETFRVDWAHPTGFSPDRVSSRIDLNAPVTTYVGTEKFEVFTRKVVRLGTTLFADGDAIGFMEQGVCVLRHKNFVPLIKPILGAKWQIES